MIIKIVERAGSVNYTVVFTKRYVRLREANRQLIAYCERSVGLVFTFKQTLITCSHREDYCKPDLESGRVAKEPNVISWFRGGFYYCYIL